MEAIFAADHLDDLLEAQHRLDVLGFGAMLDDSTGRLVTADPGTGTPIAVVATPRMQPKTYAAPAVNAPGRVDRIDARVAGILATDRVRPRRLGHFVLGTTNFGQSHAFFVDGLGFKVSDIVKDVGLFLRCSTDHHNVLIQRAPVPFIHHSSWQVDDVDAIGRGAMDVLDGHPERHVWGIGRHYAGSNFFWYCKDPAGNFAEYHSEMDSIPDDAIWSPEVLEGALGMYRWGPRPRSSTPKTWPI